MWHEVDQRIRRALNEARQGFRAVITRVDSAGGVQTAQADALAGEQLQDAELFQHYGYTSNPPPGSMAMVLPLGGRSSHSVVLATEHGSYRLQALQPGEVALYSDEGSKIVLKRGKIIAVSCDTFQLDCQRLQVNASSQASFSTPLLQTSQQLVAEGRINGNGGLAIQGGGGAQVRGDVVVAGDVTADGKSLRNHTHNGDSGGVTSPPR